MREKHEGKRETGDRESERVRADSQSIRTGKPCDRFLITGFALSREPLSLECSRWQEGRVRGRERETGGHSRLIQTQTHTLAHPKSAAIIRTAAAAAAAAGATAEPADRGVSPRERDREKIREFRLRIQGEKRVREALAVSRHSSAAGHSAVIVWHLCLA